VLSKVLTQSLYNSLQGKKTSGGVTLDLCIQTGQLPFMAVVCGSYELGLWVT